MFWTITLPSQITFAAFFCVVVVAIILAPSLQKKRTHIAKLVSLISVIVFIPSCMLVNLIVDKYRFGLFTYPDYASVNDDNVYVYLPTNAYDITIEKYPYGFITKFHISKKALNIWFADYWTRKGNDSINKMSIINIETNTDKKYLFDVYKNIGWHAPAEMVIYEGPLRKNGSGFTLLYSETNNIAFMSSYYW